MANSTFETSRHDEKATWQQVSDKGGSLAVRGPEGREPAPPWGQPTVMAMGHHGHPVLGRAISGVVTKSGIFISA